MAGSRKYRRFLFFRPDTWLENKESVIICRSTLEILDASTVQRETKSGDVLSKCYENR